MNDTLASLLREAVKQENAWVTAEREHKGCCDWCDGYWDYNEFQHDPMCWIVRARAALDDVDAGPRGGDGANG